MEKTIQQQYDLIKEGKGNKDDFLKSARRVFPELITPGNDYNTAVHILKSKSILSEGTSTVTANKNWFKIFETNLKEAVGVKDTKEYGDQNTFEKIDKDVKAALDHQFDNSNAKNIDNVYGQSFLIGYLAEMDDPKNAKKTVDELKAIVLKNMAKDINYYAKNGMFGVKGIGLETSKVSKPLKGKFKSSGYGDLKENQSPTLGLSGVKAYAKKHDLKIRTKSSGGRVPYVLLTKDGKEYGPFDPTITTKSFLDKKISPDLKENQSTNEGIGMFHDPIGFKKPELSNIDKIFTKEYKGEGMYDIFKNGKKVKSIEGEGDANAWINTEKRKLNDMSEEKLDSLKENKLRSVIRNLINEELN